MEQEQLILSVPVQYAWRRRQFDEETKTEYFGLLDPAFGEPINQTYATVEDAIHNRDAHFSIEEDDGPQAAWKQERDSWVLVKISISPVILIANDEQAPVIIMTGSLAEGYTAIGPFATHDDAAEYATNHSDLRKQSWESLHLDPSDDFEKGY